MKKLLLTALICPFFLLAQTTHELENIKTSLEALFEHLETNDITKLEPYLSEDYSVSGHKGKTAKIILKSIPFQVKRPSSYEIRRAVFENNTWKVAVEAIIDDESNDFDFLLDKLYRFLEIDMFEVSVQKTSENKEKTTLEEPLRIPFWMKENLVFFNARIKGIERQLTLLFDTGATSLVLDKTFASKNNITSKSVQEATGATGSSEYSFTEIEALHVNNFVLKNLSAVLVDLKHLTTKFSMDGIIGRDFLSRYVGKIDYDNNELVFYNDIDEIKAPFENTLSFDFENGVPIPQTSININLKSGEEFTGKVFMDTGASPNFILNSNITRDNHLLEVFNPKYVSATKGLTGEEKQYLSAIQSLHFLGKEHLDVPIFIPLSKEGVNTFPNLLGILGNGILNRYNWIFDYANMTAYYEPNRLKNNPFEYPNADFEIKREHQKMYFKNVQPNTKLAKKNIQDDMEIIAVNGSQIEDFDKIKALMKKEGVKLHITYVSQSGKQKKLKVKTKRKI